MPAGDPAYQLQVDPRPTSEAVGDERGTKRWYRQAKETKCGEKDGKESERLVVPLSQGNHPEGPWGGKGTPSHEPLEGNMPGTPRPETVSTKQQRIAELARNAPDMAFTTLAHHIDIDWLLTAHARTRKDGAVGVDGQTAEEYEVNLEGQPPGPPRPRQVRHVRGPAGASSAHPQGRLAWRDSPAGHSDLSFILHLFATGLGIAWRNSGPSVGPTLIMPPTAATMCDESVCASER